MFYIATYISFRMIKIEKLIMQIGLVIIIKFKGQRLLLSKLCSEYLLSIYIFMKIMLKIENFYLVFFIYD